MEVQVSDVWVLWLMVDGISETRFSAFINELTTQVEEERWQPVSAGECYQRVVNYQGELDSPEALSLKIAPGDDQGEWLIFDLTHDLKEEEQINLCVWFAKEPRGFQVPQPLENFMRFIQALGISSSEDEIVNLIQDQEVSLENGEVRISRENSETEVGYQQISLLLGSEFIDEPIH